MPGLKPVGGSIGAKERIQADILQQIEGKPRGDLLGAKERSQTGEAEALRKAPGPDVGLSLQPSAPRPPYRPKRRQTWSPTTGVIVGDATAKKKDTGGLVDSSRSRKGEGKQWA